MTVKVDDVPKLGELTTEQFRQKFAGLLDPDAERSVEDREEIKKLAVQFVACLPMVFGDELDRLTMWDRIGSGLEAAFSKTSSDDHEFFIQAVLTHIKAGASAASACVPLASVIATLGQWEPQDRQAWMTYFSTHLIPVMVHARHEWTRYKDERKKLGKKSNGGES